MDPILQVLLSWQFVLFGLAIAAVMYVLRIVVEYFMVLAKKNPANSTLWNELLLPILPVILGVSTGYFFKVFPYPWFTNGPLGYVVTGERVMFGLVAGLFSTLMYRVIKALLYQKLAGYAQSFQPPNCNVPDIMTLPKETMSTGQIPPRGAL